MAFFIGIACPWILVAWFLLVNQRRAADPTFGQWRAEPSMFFGGPIAEEASSSRPAIQPPSPPPSGPAAAASTVH